MQIVNFSHKHDIFSVDLPLRRFQVWSAPNKFEIVKFPNGQNPTQRRFHPATSIPSTCNVSVNRNHDYTAFSGVPRPRVSNKNRYHRDRNVRWILQHYTTFPTMTPCHYVILDWLLTVCVSSDLKHGNGVNYGSCHRRHHEFKLIQTGCVHGAASCRGWGGFTVRFHGTTFSGH